MGEEGRVAHINPDDKSICIVTSKGALRHINVADHGDKISVFSEKKTPFSQGDKVVFLKNNKGLKVQNGLTGNITSINGKGDIVVHVQSQKEVRLNIKDYAYLDHGYAVTDYKSQGQTATKVLYHAPTDKEMNRQNSNTYNSFYVSVTRGKSDIAVYTDDRTTLQEQVKKAKVKSSTLSQSKISIRHLINISNGLRGQRYNVHHTWRHSTA